VKLFPRLLVTVLVAFALSACAGMQLNQAKKASPSGSPFNFNLYNGYIGLAQDEFNEGDYDDADVFADRAIKAAANGKIKPESFKARKLPKNSIRDLRRARARLMIAFSDGAKEEQPNLAAKAQVLFDCWMQEQEENFQPSHIAGCRSAFGKTMDKLEAKLRPKTMAKKPMAKKPMMAAKPRKPEKPDVDGIYVVFFDFDSAKITSKAARVLRKAAAEYHLAKPRGITITGHTDKAGRSKYNFDLSMRRIESVVKALMVGKVPDSRILATAYGQDRPLVQTKEGKRQKQNRRVEIIFD